MSQALRQGNTTAEESAMSSGRRQSMKGGANHPSRSGRGRSVSMYGGDSEYYDSYDEELSLIHI